MNHDPFIIHDQAKGMKDSSLPNFSYQKEVGSSIITERNNPLWLGKVVTITKFNILFFSLVIIFLILFTRLGYLQLAKGSDYYDLAEGNRLRIEYQPTKRGIIFDLWHTPLVENVAAFSLYLIPHQLPSEPNQLNEIRNLLLSLFDKEAEQKVNDLLNSQSQLPQIVKENLEYEEALSLMITTQNISALEVITDPYRHYDENNINSHLLGYTSRITVEEKDNYLEKGYQLFERVGKTGLESYYEEELRGTLGRQKIEVDNLGRKLEIIAEEPSLPGKNLVLSIDNGLQQVIVESLKKYASDKAAAVVALDPKTGKVRALISWPNFDHNSFSQNLSPKIYSSIITNPLKPLYNRAIAGEYPSGSTIKIIVGAEALDQGLITRWSQINSTGGIWYDKWFFPDWKAGGHGLTNIIKALAESVNSFFYYLALDEFEDHQGLGLDNMLKAFSKVGLGKVLGIDLFGESSGFLPSKEWKEETKGEVWYPGDTLHLVIGQGDILVTPLQVASYTNVIANNGTLFKPQLVEEIQDPMTGEVIKILPEVLNKYIFKSESLDIIREGMEAVTEWGSARSYANHPMKVAGKTGTAQASGDQLPHSWFTSFAPYNDPELTLTVLVENGGEGSDVASPIARDIWWWYYNNRK